MNIKIEQEYSKDALLNGQVTFLQPKQGYRVSVDSVFLAAAVSEKHGGNILDMGCGVGAITFCLLSRAPELKITGIDIQRPLIELAKKNADLNNISPSFECGNIAEHTKYGTFDQIVTNPPYLEVGAHNPSPNDSRALANAGLADITLDKWLKTASILLKHGGYLTLVQRADRLDDILVSLKAYQMGSIVIYPLWSKSGRSANRVIVSARKQKFAPCKTLPGLIVHQDNGDYTDQAQAIVMGRSDINLYGGTV